MRKFRIAWACIVGVAALIFVIYKADEAATEDSSWPVFSCSREELQISINDGEDVLLAGITAADEKDGDVTDSIIVENISDFYGDGKRTVTYAAFDNDDHVSELERVITYTDYTQPRFELKDSLRFRVGQTINLGSMVSVWDCLDGDISNQVKMQMDSSISNRTTGIYEVVYEVTNSAGDTAILPVQAEVYQPTNREVEMDLNQYLIYYDGTETDYYKYLDTLTVGTEVYTFAKENSEGEPGNETVNAPEEEEGEGNQEGEVNYISTKNVTIQSYVDETTPGIYQVYYFYESTKYQATEVLYVVVE